MPHQHQRHQRQLLRLIRKWGLFAIGLVVSMIVLDYVIGANSDAFAFAQDILRKSENIRSRVGEV